MITVDRTEAVSNDCIVVMFLHVIEDRMTSSSSFPCVLVDSQNVDRY